MFKNTPFEAISKTMTDAAPKFNADAIEEAVKPVQDNLKIWADLAQTQAKEAQAAMAETMASIKDIKDPQAAYDIMKASAEAGMAMFAKNLKDVTSLSFGQFHSAVDAIERAHPAPQAFASVAKNMKAVAASAENAIETAMDKGAAAVAPAAKAKKSR